MRRIAVAVVFAMLFAACSGRGTEPGLPQDPATRAVWGIYDLVSINGKALPYTEAHMFGSGSTTIHSAFVGLGSAFTPEGTALYHAEWKATVTYPGEVARALRGTVPGIGVLTTPKGNIESAALIGAATAMARKAEIYKEVLVENGLPADFIEQLDGASAQLKGSLDARGLARAARASATRGLQTEIALGRRIVEIMDATLLRVLRLQPAKQAEWQQLKRIVVKGSVARGGAAAVETSPRLVESSRSLVESSPTLVGSSPALAESSPVPIVTSPTQAKTAA